MACMNDYEMVKFLCGYEPCQHEGEISFHKYDMQRWDVNKCPKCGVWNYKAIGMNRLITPELKKKLDDAIFELGFDLAREGKADDH